MKLHNTIVNNFSKKTIMSTFSFTIDQIDRIFEAANRCGQMKKDWFKLSDEKDDYPVYIEEEDKAKELKRKIKEKEKEKDYDEDDVELLKEDLEKVKDRKFYVEKKLKEEILENILKHKFEIKFDKRTNLSDGKPLYVTKKDRDSFFACKMINDELQRIYKIKQPDRNVILKNVKLLLEDNIDKILVRGDIKSFFESIPRDKLLSKICNSGFVSHRSIKLMKRMFYELSEKFDLKKGVPRGISFSSSLADIYLREIDLKVNQLDGVYFYQRYVDDIIIIASATEATPTAEMLFNKVKHIFEEYKLELHSEEDGGKFMAKDLNYSQSENIYFDYLGYNISMDTKIADVHYKLKDTTIGKYIKKIDKVFEYYQKTARINPRKKYKEATPLKAKSQKKVCLHHRQPLYRLYKLLGYLTCNYYLGGAKSNILSGIYFKHSMLTENGQLKDLDKKLYQCLDKHFKDIRSDKDFGLEKIQTIIYKKYSFEKGFTERRMCHLTSADLKMIKHVLQDNEKAED